MKQLSNEEKRKIVVEGMWLHYINNTLFEKGAIPKYLYIKMKAYINVRTDQLLKGGTVHDRWRT